MPGKTKLMKTRWYPRVHNLRHSWFHGLETGVVNQYTILPIAMTDEGLGTPSGEETNPENAAFLEVTMPNCFVDSRIDNIFAEFNISMTKPALETDKLHIINFATMPIGMAFKEDYIAIDELTSLETQDVVEMQTEATDRQGFPLYNTVKMVERTAGSATLHANVPGLT